MHVVRLPGIPLYMSMCMRPGQMPVNVFAAAGVNDVGALQCLLAYRSHRGDDIDASALNNAAFHTAVLKGHTGVVQILLAWRGIKGLYVDPRSCCNTALKTACMRGYTDLVDVLLRWRKELYTPHGHVKVACVDPTSEDNIALKMAVCNGRLAVVQRLLAWRSEVNDAAGVAKFVDPRANVLPMCVGDAYHALIVRELLAWRGPHLEFVDPSQHDWCIAKAAARHGDTATLMAMKIA